MYRPKENETIAMDTSKSATTLSRLSRLSKHPQLSKHSRPSFFAALFLVSIALVLAPSIGCKESKKTGAKKKTAEEERIPQTPVEQKKMADRILRLKENLPPVPTADGPKEMI